MEKQLREHLWEDEQLLWSGCPESFETLDRTNKKSILVGLVIKVLVALGILVLLFISSQQNGKNVSPAVIVIYLAFAAYAIMTPFLVARHLRRNTIYGLTDKRVIRSGQSDQAVPYERIKSAVLRTDDDGHTSLLCGSRAYNLKPCKWRGEADAAFINGSEEPEAERVILYALPMDSRLEELLKKYLPLQ